MKKIFSILLLGTLSACSSFLEPDSPSEYVPKTADALNEMLLGQAYPTAGSDASELFSFHTALDDDFEMSTENMQFPVATYRDKIQAVYAWNPLMFELTVPATENWSIYYQKILGANAALDYLDDVNGTEEDKAYVRAQALALRAFYYFNLVNLYGEPYGSNPEGPGVPLKLESDLMNDDMQRASVKEVYEQIIKDLNGAENAFSLLPAEKQKPGTYRINLPAVQLLHARVCLYMNDMENAAKYAKQVIDDWGYELYDLNTNDILTPNYMSLENPETIWAYGNPKDLNSMTTQTAYWVEGTTVHQDVYTHVFTASEALINCFKDANDLRKNYYLVKEWRDEQEVNGVYLPYSKRALQDDRSVETADEFGFSLRLSEAYLIVAEAVYNTDQELALRMINDLREKRYATGTYQKVNYSGEALLNFIREERRRELCFEGHRWFDLRRYGMPKFSHRWVENGSITGSYVIEEKDAAYLLPIPSAAIEQNGGLEQNRLTTPKTLQ